MSSAANPFRPERFFKSLKAARVSEISEATAASGVPEKDRINFHIGHPLRDERLLLFYFRTVTGHTQPSKAEKDAEQPKTESFEEDWEYSRDIYPRFIWKTLQTITPYMPRGGFSSKQPHAVIRYLRDYLLHQQQDAIGYDDGNETGLKEIMIGSGGIWENLRVLFHSLSVYLKKLPAPVLLYNVPLPNHLTMFDRLQFKPLSADEDTIAAVRSCHSGAPETLCFMIIGSELSEQERRRLRSEALSHPIIFVEINGAPNHRSLAREAGMANRVLRMLAPDHFCNNLPHSALTFILGNATLVKMLETAHFEIKGTPPASEVELLDTLLKAQTNGVSPVGNDDKVLSDADVSIEETVETIPGLRHTMERFEQVANQLEERIKKLPKPNFRLDRYESLLQEHLRAQTFFPITADDPLSGSDTAEIVQTFFREVHKEESAWLARLPSCFLVHFIKHHPYYSFNRCTVVSGSSRTALSLLGHHCGIREVLVPDLSWSYEHVFPQVQAVGIHSLDNGLAALITAAEERLRKDGQWIGYGAVVLNNPHNASGAVYRHGELGKLLLALLPKGITVIEDLSYHNVAPQPAWPQIPTLKQVAMELHRKGRLAERDLNHLITVHSLSKTDCFAGGRIAVTEILRSDRYQAFESANSYCCPNDASILMAYLFYRNEPEALTGFWRLRNRIMAERLYAMKEAQQTLPEERNPYGITLHPPSGSMYPTLEIQHLPAGLSLDWLASGLAAQGIGLIPLSAFARTKNGFESARKTFRLTLGGSINSESLFHKTRRLLIDLNRLIASEAGQYYVHHITHHYGLKYRTFQLDKTLWCDFEKQMYALSAKRFSRILKRLRLSLVTTQHERLFVNNFLPYRLRVLRKRIEDACERLSFIAEGEGASGVDMLGREFYKDDLPERESAFRIRLYDRTVHPTQMYSLRVDVLWDQTLNQWLFNRPLSQDKRLNIFDALVEEYFGLNVFIDSVGEAEELILDLKTHIATEEFIRRHGRLHYHHLLSFWGDWDGSNRPSGQGHRLVAAVVIENIRQLAGIVSTIKQLEPDAPIDPELLAEIKDLPRRLSRFWKLLNDITLLTNQLEKRFRRFLPYDIEQSRLRKLAVRLHLAQDPMTLLWQHNDRLERRMLELREKRSRGLAFYFGLNKRLRKCAYDLLPLIRKHWNNRAILTTAGCYRNLLRRFVLTPRIHQNLITARDPFAIDTTVHNIMEINAIGGRYGNPGMVQGLQVSMANSAEALIALDRKLQAGLTDFSRKVPDAPLARVRAIPLFEEREAVEKIPEYLDQLWQYTNAFRRIDQNPSRAFAEHFGELFIAGSDLSQQVGQAAGLFMFQEARQKIVKWLAEHNLIDDVRIKLGSGEPMQRQGAYYDLNSGAPAFIDKAKTVQRLFRALPPAAAQSTRYAISPLRGVMAGGDLRTVQSNLAERMRFLGDQERAALMFHLQNVQRISREEIARAGEPLLETRLQFKQRGLEELKRLTIGNKGPYFRDFTELVNRNFRNIVYGREEDLFGIHIFSYFISRAMPPLRDRPAIRPAGNEQKDLGRRILDSLSETLPLAHQGSLIRAIGHNRAQTMILGINQLTTGLFRAFQEFSHQPSGSHDQQLLLTENILPHLPVYDILHTLRLYHERDRRRIAELESLFPPGNKVFSLLREDREAIATFIPPLQKELLRRHGLNAGDFFVEEALKADVIGALRPDLAVLLQKDLFNCDPERFLAQSEDITDEPWRRETQRLLKLPEQIAYWRECIWSLIGPTIREQISHFVELAQAIQLLKTENSQNTSNLVGPPPRAKIERLSSDIKYMLRDVRDDSLQRFFMAVVQYMNTLPQQLTRLPVDVIRILQDVQRLVKLEEQVFTSEEQALLRFYILQTARISGENG